MNYNQPQLVPFASSTLTEIGYTLTPDGVAAQTRVSLTVGSGGVINVGGGWYQVPAIVAVSFLGRVVWDSLQTTTAEKIYDRNEVGYLDADRTRDNTIAADALNIRTRMAVQVAEPSPVVVIAPPSGVEKCRVIGYFEKEVDVTFTLLPSGIAAKSGVILVAHEFTLKSDFTGFFNREIWRNDLIIPANTRWKISVPKAGINATVTLDTPTFDLGTLISP